MPLHNSKMNVYTPRYHQSLNTILLYFICIENETKRNGSTHEDEGDRCITYQLQENKNGQMSNGHNIQRAQNFVTDRQFVDG